jgi:hypothetical protein
MPLNPAQQAYLGKLGKNAPGDLNAELRQKAQQGIADRMYKAGEATDRELHELVEEILLCPELAGTGCKASYAPLKDRGTAEDKVIRDYGGDWYDLKDVVRMTIITPSLRVTKKVQAKIRAMFGLGVGRPGLGLIKDIEVNAGSDPCGYSGANFVVRLSNRRPAEIQVNIPVMIYGKEKEKNSKTILGEKQFYDIKGRFIIEGGRGHTLYEMYRVDKAGPIGKEAAYLSSRYYNFLRGFPYPQLARELQRDISAFMSDPSVYIKKADAAFLAQGTRRRR